MAVITSINKDEWFLADINTTTLDFINKLSDDPLDVNGSYNRSMSKNSPFWYVQLTSKAKTKNPTILCKASSDEAEVGRLNSYISANSIEGEIMKENELVNLLANEVASLYTMYTKTESMNPMSSEFFDTISTVELYARSLHKFLCTSAAITHKALKAEIEKDINKLEQLCIACEKKIVYVLGKPGTFFVKRKSSEKEERDLLKLNGKSFIKYGDYDSAKGNESEIRTLTKNEYLRLRTLLSCLNGFSSNKHLEDNEDTAARSAKGSSGSPSGGSSPKHAEPSAREKKLIRIIDTRTTGKPDSKIVRIRANAIPADIYDTHMESLPTVYKKIKIVGRGTTAKVNAFEATCKDWKDLKSKILDEYSSGSPSSSPEPSTPVSVKKLMINARNLESIVSAAYESISAGATAGGVEPSEQYDTIWEPVYHKIKEFEKKKFPNEDAIREESLMLEGLVRRKMLSDEAVKDAQEMIERIAAVKIAQLGVANALITATSTKEEESVAYKGDANQFNMNVKTYLTFGVFTVIDVASNTREKFSWTKKLAAVCNELWGYQPQGYIINVINMYSATREFNGAVLQRVGEITDSIIQTVLPNFNVGSNVGKYIHNSLMQEAGEVDPQVVNLEQRLRNPSKSIIFACIHKKHIDQEYKDDNYTYKLSKDRPMTKTSEKTSEENKRKHNMSRYLSDSKDYGYLNGIYTMNEDFAPAGGFAEMTGGAGQVGETVTPGLDFNYPGVISGMGSVHAPTPEQTPFKNGEKTSTNDSGSGDCFTAKSTKKSKKKYTSKIPLVRVAD